MWSDQVTRIKWKRDLKSNGGWSYIGIMYRLLRDVVLAATCLWNPPSDAWNRKFS